MGYCNTNRKHIQYTYHWWCIQRLNYYVAVMNSEKLQKALFRATDEQKIRAQTLTLSFPCLHKLTKPLEIMNNSCRCQIAQGKIDSFDNHKLHVPLNGCFDITTQAFVAWESKIEIKP